MSEFNNILIVDDQEDIHNDFVKIFLNNKNSKKSDKLANMLFDKEDDNNHTKLIHIFLNLLKNAIDSLKQKNDERIIEIEIIDNNNQITVKFSDNGIGIEDKNIKKIFNYGFTTKRESHGFRLHSCANMIKEIGGSIKVTCEGMNKDALFLISLSKNK